MRIILLRSEQYEGTKLYRVLFPLGHRVVLATDPNRVQLQCAQSLYDRVLVWMSQFRVANGATLLVNFLEGLPTSQPVSLIVSPDMKSAVEALQAQLGRQLPRVSEIWVVPPADEVNEIPARLDALTTTATPNPQPAMPPPSSGLPQGTGALSDASAAMPAAPVNIAASPSPLPPSGILVSVPTATPPAQVISTPAPVPPMMQTLPGTGPFLPQASAAPLNATGWVGLWSVRGGCGATTLAIELARRSGSRTLIGLDNPSLAMALGLASGDPWTPQAAHSFPRPVVLGISRYELSDSQVILDGITRTGLARVPAIVDLPSGADPLTRAVLQAGLLSHLVVVLTPDRATVALAVHALSIWLPNVPVSLIWNMADGSAVTNARSGLSLLRMIDLSEAGMMGYHANVREARNRCQSLTDAASDGVSLGNLVAQAAALAATLLPELAGTNAQPLPGTGKLNRRRKLFEVTE